MSESLPIGFYLVIGGAVGLVVAVIVGFAVWIVMRGREKAGFPVEGGRDEGKGGV